MSHNQNYHFGILYLMYLLMGADGVIEAGERAALLKVKKSEEIPEDTLIAFEKDIIHKKEREIYQAGIDCLNQCTDEEKLKAFIHLYKMSESDGNVHVKEVRLLLYSIRMAGIEFNDVVDKAKHFTY